MDQRPRDTAINVYRAAPASRAETPDVLVHTWNGILDALAVAFNTDRSLYRKFKQSTKP